jgi:UDP-N-acetylglucosamine--N-acetylmuramyl-(pentapeptide) pyrophosphoryl-undecaprenol N-acetylglucosamine transferase
MNHSITFVAGRSGGHILPAITLAQQHKKKNPDFHIFFMSTSTPLDYALINKHSFIIHHIPFNLNNIPSNILKYPLYCLQITIVCLKSLYIFKKHRPKKIISTGGYISLPVCLAAWILRIPIELYELNATPGKAIKALAPLATTIFTPFKSAKNMLAPYNAIVSPYPIKFTNQDKLARSTALRTLKLCEHKKTLLILGGSQGSFFINDSIKKFVQETMQLHASIQILHQTGRNATDDYQKVYHDNNIPAHVFEYHDSMALYYSAADLIICRAGAGTLFEALFFQKPCIVIPLETITTLHQKDNALELAQQYPRLITVLKQHELSDNHRLLAESIIKHFSLANSQVVSQSL